jgi:hypothetical protein
MITSMPNPNYQFLLCEKGLGKKWRRTEKSKNKAGKGYQNESRKKPKPKEWRGRFNNMSIFLAGPKKNPVISGRENSTHECPTGHAGPQFSG